MSPVCVLVIAGSDSSAGAGLQADLKTLSALSVYAATVVTAVTAQNTVGVSNIHYIPPDVIVDQIEAVCSDMPISAVKIGMIGSRDGICAVANALQRLPKTIPIVLDPVMVSTSGSNLFELDAQESLIRDLFPLAWIITPNRLEAAALLNNDVAQNELEVEGQARQLMAFRCQSVLIKGGHSDEAMVTDILYDGTNFSSYSLPRIDTKNTHGTGCTLASAIGAYLAKGFILTEAVQAAKVYTHEAIIGAVDWTIGRGHGPLHHFHKVSIEASNKIV